MKKDLGGNTNQRKYWGKGFAIGKRKDNRVYHEYTKIGFVCTNESGEEIKRPE